MSWSAIVQIVVAWVLLLMALMFVGQWADAPLPFLAVALLFVVAALGRIPIANTVNGWWLRRGSVVRPGHYIRLEGKDDVEGYVASIGWRHTQLQTPAGDIARIPNTTLANSIFTNFHLPASRDAIPVEFNAAEPIEPARIVALLHQEARAASRMHQDLIPDSPFPGCRRYVMHCRVTNPERSDDARSDRPAASSDGCDAKTSLVPRSTNTRKETHDRSSPLRERPHRLCRRLRPHADRRRSRA